MEEKKDKKWQRAFFGLKTTKEIYEKRTAQQFLKQIGAIKSLVDGTQGEAGNLAVTPAFVLLTIFRHVKQF